VQAGRWAHQGRDSVVKKILKHPEADDGPASRAGASPLHVQPDGGVRRVWEAAGGRQTDHATRATLLRLRMLLLWLLATRNLALCAW
jgi:hypothetical protein